MIVRSFQHINNNNQDLTTKSGHCHLADESTSDMESFADYPKKEIPSTILRICLIALWTIKMIRNTFHNVIQEPINKTNVTTSTSAKLPAKSPAPCRTKSIYLDQTWLKKSMKLSPTKKKDLSASATSISAASTSIITTSKRSNSVSYKNHSMSIRSLSSWRRNCQHRRHSYPPHFQTTLSLIEEVDEL